MSFLSVIIVKNRKRTGKGGVLCICDKRYSETDKVCVTLCAYICDLSVIVCVYYTSTQTLSVIYMYTRKYICIYDFSRCACEVHNRFVIKIHGVESTTWREYCFEKSRSEQLGFNKNVEFRKPALNTRDDIWSPLLVLASHFLIENEQFLQKKIVKSVKNWLKLTAHRSEKQKLLTFFLFRKR